MTHEQYLDTPIAEVEWLLRIDAIQKEKPPPPASAGGGAAPPTFTGPPRIT